MDIVKVPVTTCVAFVALIWLAACQETSGQAVSSSTYARPQESSVAADVEPKPPPPAVGTQIPWDDRSGEAEALADIANGRPVKLYTHLFSGERGGFRTPGLLYCDPDQNIGNKAAEALFSFIPDANLSEGVAYSDDELRLKLSATRFAWDYNVTIFHKKRKYIVSFCPKAELENTKKP